MKAKFAARRSARGKATLQKRSDQETAGLVFPASHQRNTAPTGREKSMPSYGRLLERMAIPSPIASAPLTDGRFRIRPRPPRASAPPSAGTAPPQNEFIQ